MPEFSVIVPIYNVEKYLEQCITSVLNQTYKDFELICVDDCGTDNSIKIAEKYAQKDSRIKILHQEKNKGLSAARNLGLDNACGKYIVFLDSDDWLETNCLEVLQKEFVEQKTYSIWFDGYKYLDDEQKRCDEKLLNNCRGYLAIKPDNIANFSDYAWIKAYTRESIEKYKLRFPEGLCFEDGEFYFKYFTYYPRTYIIEDCLYNYRIRKGSIVTNAQCGNLKIKDIYDIVYNIRDFYIENKFYEKYKKALASLVCKRIETCRTIANHYEISLVFSDKMLKDFGYPQEFEFLMDNMPKETIVSIVIPIYNVEKYIEQCIKSVQTQTYKKLEIICVDDCGQDNSIKIVENLAKNDNRIKIVYHEKNKGLGGARNTGLKEATGDYIFFLDSDDWLEGNCVQEVLNIFEELDLDTVWFKPNVYWEETNNTTDISPMFPFYAQCKGGYEILDENNLINYPLYSWNKAYKREFLIKNNLKWRENVYFEDVEFYFQTFIKSPEIYIIDKPLYNYRRRDDSIISSATREIEKAKDLYYVTAEVYKYLKKENLLKKYKKAYARYVVDALNMFKNFPDIYQSLGPIMQNFLKEINYPEDFQ